MFCRRSTVRKGYSVLIGSHRMDTQGQSLGYQRWMEAKALSLSFRNRRFGGTDFISFALSQSPLIGSLKLF